MLLARWANTHNGGGGLRNIGKKISEEAGGINDRVHEAL